MRVIEGWNRLHAYGEDNPNKRGNNMKHNKLRLRFLAATSFLAAQSVLLNTPAAAQDGADDAQVQRPAPNSTTQTEVNGERVIVVTAENYVPTDGITATKSDIPLIETPQSVSVITRDQIDLLNYIDAQQAVRYVAGVSGENYGPDLRFDFIQVRGFTPKQFIDGLATPVTTSILSNGVDLYAFESFDILKGPASVLYGSSPPGGLYNQTSRRPSSEFGGEISAKYGEDDYKQLALTMTGAMSEFLDARITMLYRNRDAERDGVSAERLLAAPSLTAHLGPDTDLTALLYYQYDKVKGDTNGFLPVLGTLLTNPLGQIDRSTNLGEPDYNQYERRQYGAGFDFSHDFSSSFGLDINFKYSEYSEDQRVIYGAGLDADNRTVSRFNFPYQEDTSSIAVDGRLHGDITTGDIEHKLMVGLDYRNVENDAKFGFGGASSIDLFDPVYGAGGPITTPDVIFTFNDQRVKQTGIYAQDQIGLGNLKLLVSGRYDWVEVNNRAAGTTDKQDEFTYRVGLNYVTESGVAPYVSYATSFEPVIGTDDVGDAYVPATGRQIEGGLKYDGRGLGPDIDIFASVAAFQIKQENLVVSQVGPTGPPIGSVQTGEVEVYGGEVELLARIRDQLTINGSYSYTNSEIVESATAVEIGADLPVTPKHKFSLLVDYTLQQGALGGLGFGIGGRYTSSSAGSLPGTFNPVVYRSNSATLFDAIIHYDTPGWRFAINGSNILDKRYVARCAAANNCTFGAGRQIIGTVTKKF